MGKNKKDPYLKAGTAVWACWHKLHVHVPDLSLLELSVLLQQDLPLDVFSTFLLSNDCETGMGINSAVK